MARYRRIKEELPSEEYTVPIGQAAVVRSGRDLSIITYGAMVHAAAEAADCLQKEGVSIEIVDLRTLAPLDERTILESVRKTHRLLIVYEGVKIMGIGAEISAMIAESDVFDFLDAPIIRHSDSG